MMLALRHLDALDLTCAQSHAVPAPVAYFVQNSAGLPMAFVVQESAGDGGHWRENLESLGELIKAKEISNASKTNLLITVKAMLSYFKAFLSSATEEHIDEILSELMKLKQSIKRATKKNQNGLDSESIKDEDVKNFCDHLNTFLKSDFIPTIETNFPADQLHLENFSHAIAAIITEENNSMLDCMDSVVQCMKFYVDNKGSASTTGKRSLPAVDAGLATANLSSTQTPSKAAKTTQDVPTKKTLQSGALAATKIVVFVKDKNGETESKTLDFDKVRNTASLKLDLRASELLREYGANTNFDKEDEILEFVQNKQYKCHKYQLAPSEKKGFLFDDNRQQDEITNKEATLADILKINPDKYNTTRDDNICAFAIVFDLTKHASVQEQGPAQDTRLQQNSENSVRFLLQQDGQYKTYTQLPLKKEKWKTKKLQTMLDMLQGNSDFKIMRQQHYRIVKKEMQRHEHRDGGFNSELIKKSTHGSKIQERDHQNTMQQILEIDKNKFITEEKKYHPDESDDHLKYAFVLVIVVKTKRFVVEDAEEWAHVKPRESPPLSQSDKNDKNLATQVAQDKGNDQWPEEAQKVIDKFSDNKKQNFQMLKAKTIRRMKKISTEILVGLLQSFNNLEENVKDLDVWFKKRETILKNQWGVIETSSEESSSDED